MFVALLGLVVCGCGSGASSTPADSSGSTGTGDSSGGDPSGNAAAVNDGPADDSTVQLADTVFTGGKVYTVDEKQTWAEAVAVKENKIVFVGFAEDVKSKPGRAAAASTPRFSTRQSKTSNLPHTLQYAGVLQARRPIACVQSGGPAGALRGRPGRMVGRRNSSTFVR